MEQNSVTQVVLYDAKTGGRETSPININGNWNVYGSANWWKRLGHFSLRLDMNGNHSNRVSMINEDKSLEPKKSTTRDTGLGCDANVSYQPTWGGIDFSTSWNYQYSLNSINDNDTYTRNYSFRLEGTLIFLLACNYGLTGLILSVMVRISVKAKMTRCCGMQVPAGGS